VIKSHVWIGDTTTGQVRHITCATQDLCSVGVTGRSILGRDSEDVGILRVSRQGQRQGDLKLVTLCLGRSRM
jgi:hypothetical protein